MKNWYQILQVSPLADVETIRAAAKALSVKYHPDKPTGNEAKFKDVQQAKLVLCDAKARKQFDIELWNRSQVRPRQSQQSQRTPQAPQPAHFDPADIIREKLARAAQDMGQQFADAAQGFVNQFFENLSGQIQNSHYQRRRR